MEKPILIVPSASQSIENRHNFVSILSLTGQRQGLKLQMGTGVLAQLIKHCSALGLDPVINA